MRLEPSLRNATRLQPKMLTMFMGSLYKYCGLVLVLGCFALGGCTTASSDPAFSPSSETTLDAQSESTDSDSSVAANSVAEPDATLDETSAEPDDDTSELTSSASKTETKVDPEDESDTKADTATESDTDTEADTEPEGVDATPESSPHFIAEDHLDSFLYQYYDLINQRQYQQAWAKLNPEMQADSSYDSYVDWWNSIRRVDVQSINHVYAGTDGGEVMVLVSYDKGTSPAAREVLVMSIGSSPSESVEDRSQGDWQIRSVDVAETVSPTQTQDATPLLPTSSLVINGIGPIRVGMTLQEAANATGLPMATRGLYGRDECEYYEAIGSPNGISFMVSNSRIVRVDINTAEITTLSGAGIDSSVEEIKALYPGKIEESAHKYVTGGQYLRFVPTDASDQKYRILFETDENGKVTQFRSGFAEEVGYVEGCS